MKVHISTLSENNSTDTVTNKTYSMQRKGGREIRENSLCLLLEPMLISDTVNMGSHLQLASPQNTVKSTNKNMIEPNRHLSAYTIMA